MFEVIAAGIAALGAVLSAMFAANAKTWSRDVSRLEQKVDEKASSASREAARLENKIDEQARVSAQKENDLWGELRGMHNRFIPRKEFDLHHDDLKALKQDLRELQAELKNDTRLILEAINNLKR